MPLERIELLGPSGVGKSTILQALLRQRGRLQGDLLFPIDIAPLLEGLHGEAAAGDRLRRAMDNKGLEEFIGTCFGILARSRMLPSQRISAVAMVRKSCEDLHAISGLPKGRTVLHDELALHRAFSLLPGSPAMEQDARDYFEVVPVPEHAFILKADPEIISERVLRRKRRPNCYRGVSDMALSEVIARLLTACDVAAEVLARRGVRVHVLDASRPSREVAEDIVRTLNGMHAVSCQEGSMLERLLNVSGSFRKKDGRHHLRRQQVAYCSFTTPAVNVPAELAQRNAMRRLARFDLVRSQVEGRSVLDLGSNSGAMLFELSNRGIRSGLGIEYDAEKVQLAREIAAASGLRHLEFLQADIDALSAGELGRFDLVLALAIEAHVLQPERLLELLAGITDKVLYFEGNGGCDIEGIARRLLEAGFDGVAHLGMCDDDVEPANNNRPLLKAWKA